MKYVSKFASVIASATIFFLIVGFVLLLPEYLLLSIVIVALIGFISALVLRDWSQHVSIHQGRTRITY